MKKFTRALEKHRNIVFASTTQHGVGALHFRHKLPYYRIKRVCDSLGFSINNEFQHKDHLQIRNKERELVGTLVNLNLLLLPKYVKTRSESVLLAERLLTIIP